jgi:hypothetical protein
VTKGGDGQKMEYIEATFDHAVTARRVIISAPHGWNGIMTVPIELQWYNHINNQWVTHTTTSHVKLREVGVAYVPLPSNITTTRWRLTSPNGYVCIGLFCFA